MSRAVWLAAIALAPAVARADAPPPPPPYAPLALTVEAGVTNGQSSGFSGVTAPSLGVDVGYRTDATTSVGLHFAISDLSLTSGPMLLDAGTPYSVIPISIGGFVSKSFLDVAWAGLFVGAHLDRDRLAGTPPTVAWNGGAELGLYLGFDLVKLHGQAFGVFAAFESEVAGDDYVGVSGGIAYRR